MCLLSIFRSSFFILQSRLFILYISSWFTVNILSLCITNFIFRVTYSSCHLTSTVYFLSHLIFCLVIFTGLDLLSLWSDFFLNFFWTLSLWHPIIFFFYIWNTVTRGSSFCNPDLLMSFSITNVWKVLKGFFYSNVSVLWLNWFLYYLIFFYVWFYVVLILKLLTSVFYITSVVLTLLWMDVLPVWILLSSEEWSLVPLFFLHGFIKSSRLY